MGERSERGTVAGDSADDDDALATSDLVVRHKNPASGGVDFLEMMGGKSDASVFGCRSASC